MITNRSSSRNFLIAIAAAAPFALVGCAGDSDMMKMEEVEPLTIPDGLAQSTATPVHASDDGDTLAAMLPDPAILFAPLLAMFTGDPSEPNPSSQLTDDIQVKTVSSDGNNGFHVTYAVAGEEHMIHFEADDYLDGQYYYLKNVGGIDYFLATSTHCCPNKAIERPCNILF